MTTDETDSITIPASVLAGHKCKPGDVLQMKVVDVDDDGSAEVTLAGKAYAGEGGGESMSDEMDRYPMEG